MIGIIDHSNFLELEMEQHTGSKLGKEYVEAVYCHPAYLAYMQSTSGEMLDWVKHKLDCSTPGLPVHGILQAKILDWVAFSFSRRSSGCKE